MIAFTIFTFAIVYSCVVIRDSKDVDVDVQVGPNKENTNDRTGVMLRLDSMQDNQEMLIEDVDSLLHERKNNENTLNPHTNEKDTITRPTF